MDQFLHHPEKLFDRPDTTVVASFAQLQKMWTQYHQPEPLTYSASLSQITTSLHGFTQKIAAHIITKHQDEIIVVVDGQVSTTKLSKEIWRVATSAHASTWWLQNPDKPFEALTTAVIKLS